MTEFENYINEQHQAHIASSPRMKLYFSLFDAPFVPVFSAMKNISGTKPCEAVQDAPFGSVNISSDGKSRILRFVKDYLDDGYAWRNSNDPAQMLRNDPEQHILGRSYLETIKDHLASPRYKSASYNPACIFELEALGRATLNTLSLAYVDASKTEIRVTRADKAAHEQKFRDTQPMLAELAKQLSQPNAPVLIPDFEEARIITPYTAVYAANDAGAIATEIAEWVYATAGAVTCAAILQELAKIKTEPVATHHQAAVNAFEASLRKAGVVDQNVTVKNAPHAPKP